MRSPDNVQFDIAALQKKDEGGSFVLVGHEFSANEFTIHPV